MLHSADYGYIFQWSVDVASHKYFITIILNSHDSDSHYFSAKMATTQKALGY
jgi:hypothetical protein